MSKKEMTKKDAARIMSAEAKKHGGEVPKGSFGARAQSAADQHASKSGEK